MKKDDALLSEYKKSFIRYAEFFGIKNYELFFYLNKENLGRGMIELNFNDKIAYVYLCKEAIDDDAEDIDKIAFHEAAEMFCYEHFSHYLDVFDRIGNSNISAAASHSVIRFLENELYPKIRHRNKEAKQ